MAQQFPELADIHQKFIRNQKIFFVATADAEGRINLSPKGHDSLKVISPNEILWMNLTGSGNETAAHLAKLNRMTLMWCAFDGPPRILRAYGTAETIYPHHKDWEECAGLIPHEVGTRQYYRMKVEMVQTSCGYAVPLYDYTGDRPVLKEWSDKKGPDGIRDYWEEKNQISLDGLPTGILE